MPTKGRLPSLNGLRAFEAAARHLSFTRAAAELNVTQAAISHQIRTLEDRLGLKLFIRRHRALALTAAGAQYLPGVSTAFDGLVEATARLADRRQGGTLTVSTLASFAIKWLVPRLAGFQAAHPGIDVRITTSSDLTQFERDEVDMAIRYGRGGWPGLGAARLLGEDLFPVCSPALLAGPAPLARPADLARHTLLHVTGFRDDWRIWLTANDTDGIDLERGLTFDQSVATLQAAIDSLGVALGRTALVAADLAAGRLVAPFDVVLPAESAYYVVAPEATWNQPKVARFRDWLLQTVDREAAG